MITGILFIAVVLFVLYGLVVSTDKLMTRRHDYAVIDEHSVKYRSRF
ncbi:MAG: hypothetical protein OHK003_28330 [Anaerolineales bacterium]